MRTSFLKIMKLLALCVAIAAECCIWIIMLAVPTLAMAGRLTAGKLWLWAIWSGLALMLYITLTLLGVRSYVFRQLRRRPKVSQTAPTQDRCVCGYLLENLTLARCPECGRVFGFDATAEELGLTGEQLERAQAARLRRRQHGPDRIVFRPADHGAAQR